MQPALARPAPPPMPVVATGQPDAFTIGRTIARTFSTWRRHALAFSLLTLILNVVFGTLFWVAPGVVYHDLRVAKEGVATAQLAAVFE